MAVGQSRGIATLMITADAATPDAHTRCSGRENETKGGLEKRRRTGAKREQKKE